MSFPQANSGKRRSQVLVPSSGGNMTKILPSQTGCQLGPETEACYNNRTTITLGQYMKGPQ